MIERHLSELVEIRHGLHRHPELAFDVHQTAQSVATRLESAGFEVTTGVGVSGVVGTLRLGGSARSIGLRADMDALPITETGAPEHRSMIDGVFHGCGHDGHTTMLLGAALCLAERLAFNGVVNLIFQPDEENGRGALAMIDEGLFERFPVDAVFGLHNLPGLPIGHFAFQAGPMAAFEENFEITIHGRGGHASMPELAIDPVVVAAEIVLQLQTIVSRSIPPREHAVVSVTEVHTDGARNIIPSTVTIRGDVRGFTKETSSIVRRRMEEISHGVTSAHGASYELFYGRAFEPLINTERETAFAVEVAASVKGSTVDAGYGRVSFSEDFGRMLELRPGCLVLMGNGTSGPQASQLHSPSYDFNDESIGFGVEYWVRLVEQFLAMPG